MLSLSQPWMHVSCLQSQFGTRWSQTRNVSLILMIKPLSVGTLNFWNVSSYYDFKACLFSQRTATVLELLLYWKMMLSPSYDQSYLTCTTLYCILFGESYAYKQRQTVQHSSTVHSVHMPLSSEAWECTLSSLSLWCRLWFVADQAPASSSWNVSSFSDGSEEAARRGWKSSS